MKQDTLTKLKQKKKLWLTPKHPLFLQNSKEDKINYAATVWQHAALNPNMSPLNNFELQRLMTKGFELTTMDMSKVVALTKSNSHQSKNIDLLLDNSKKQYIFILDIFCVSVRGGTLSDEEIQSIESFTNMFNMSWDKMDLLHQFIINANSLNYTKCLEVIRKMESQKMDITMSELKYYIPELEYVTQIDNRVLKDGEELSLIDDCRIESSIVVPKGAILSIINATVNMNGVIIVDGGKLIIRNSRMVDESSDSKQLIYVKSFSDVEIEHSTINCKSRGRAIKQENGSLKIISSVICNSTKSSAISFWGEEILIEQTQFRNCFTVKDGGAIRVIKGTGLIKECSFTECEAKNGGALHVPKEIMIQECQFKYCSVTQFGSAIYYCGEVKSNITDCEYYDCFPKNEELVQYIGDIREKVITKEEIIRVTTILDCNLIISPLGILTIENATIYVNYSIRCLGMIHIKNSKIIAWNLTQRDLIILERSKGCKVEYSEFDGRMKSGIFFADGNKIYVHKCKFINTANGRAIYDAFEPVITESIFSYCHAGGINCCSGSVIESIFINCRERKGAGILMYGSRGMITDCKFIRCVSDYSGGAVDVTRGNRVVGCTYEDSSV